jgi:hypothetical protein
MLGAGLLLKLLSFGRVLMGSKYFWIALAVAGVAGYHLHAVHGARSAGLSQGRAECVAARAADERTFKDHQAAIAAAVQARDGAAARIQLSAAVSRAAAAQRASDTTARSKGATEQCLSKDDTDALRAIQTTR